MPRPTPRRADAARVQLRNSPGSVVAPAATIARAIGRTFAGKASAAVRFAAAPLAWASSRLVGFPTRPRSLPRRLLG